MNLDEYEIGEKFQCSEGIWWIKFNETQAAYDWEMNEAIREQKSLPVTH